MGGISSIIASVFGGIFTGVIPTETGTNTQGTGETGRLNHQKYKQKFPL
jgi:hypothetical protein